MDKIFQALTMLKERQTCTSTASTASTVATRIAAIQDAFLSTNKSSANNTVTSNNANHTSEKRVSVYQQQNGRLVNGDQKDDGDDVETIPTAAAVAAEGGVAKGLAQLGIGGAMMVAETAALAAATMTNHCQADNKRASVIEKISQHHIEADEREPLNVDAVDGEAVTNRRRSSYSGSQRSCASSCCCSSSACSYCSRRCSYVSSSNFDGDESSTAAARQISYDGSNVNNRRVVRKRSANCQTDPISPPPFLEDDAFISEGDAILHASVAAATSECQHHVTDYVEMDAAALLAAASPPITPSDIQRPPSLRKAKISTVSPPPPPPPVVEPCDQPLPPAPNHPPPPPVPKRGTKKKKGTQRAAHKIIINLDDKDKFTEEVTV